jgi:Common central domain of tyrosinase
MKANLLPTRPSAHQASPELFRRWNAMFHDPSARNLAGQMNLHAQACEDTPDCQSAGTVVPNVHSTSDFVLWHRAFLYYHEQILSALGDTPVGLPYWDWTTDDTLPPAFDITQFDFRDNLSRSGDFLDADIFSAAHLTATVAAYRSMAPADASIGLFEDPIHTYVHQYFGWRQRSNLMTAAGDPAFYGHHGNLDRLATHIFEKGWPAPTGFHYRFVLPDKTSVCTTLDQFATMPSPYAGDTPMDTSHYRVEKLEIANRIAQADEQRVRIRLHFTSPLMMGSHPVYATGGAPLGIIVSLHHHGMSNFVLWITLEKFQRAAAEGIRNVGNSAARISSALLVSRDG